MKIYSAKHLTKQKASLFFATICIFLLISCGESTEKQILGLQEKTYQDGISCLNRENLHACGDFVDTFKELTELFVKDIAEIKRKAKNGDKDCQQILFNYEKIIEMGNAIAQ